MSLFGANSSASTTTSGTSTDTGLANDVDLVSPPEDSVSDMSFSPQADFLAVSSWDNKVRIYQVARTGQSEGKALYEHEGPVLSVAWSQDGTKVASGGSDRAGRIFDLNTSQSSQVAAHDASVSAVKFVEVPGSNQPLLATASWDKTLRYWDLRQQTPVSTVQLPERAYRMDASRQLLVLGTAERRICIFNLSNPGTIFKNVNSPLKWQTRVVSCYPTGDGYAVGSIEGRCAFQYIEERDQNLAFSFKCHRETSTSNGQPVSQVYAVNAISFHPQYGTFSTAGADGSLHFWDKVSKHRLKGHQNLKRGPISSTAFSRDGTIFAYSLSYDWSKGYQYHTQDQKDVIKLHATEEVEVKPRGVDKNRR